MTPQKDRKLARKAWQPPHLRRFDAGRAEAGNVSSRDGAAPGTNLS